MGGDEAQRSAVPPVVPEPVVLSDGMLLVPVPVPVVPVPVAGVLVSGAGAGVAGCSVVAGGGVGSRSSSWPQPGSVPSGWASIRNRLSGN